MNTTATSSHPGFSSNASQLGRLAQLRLLEERKKFRRSHNVGFTARPRSASSSTTRGDDADVPDLAVWDCEIPGKRNSVWEGGIYHLKMEFPEDYPLAPPVCTFEPPIPHPNVYRNGRVCTSILTMTPSASHQAANEDVENAASSNGGGHDISIACYWDPSLSISEILVSIQYLMCEPNPFSPAQAEALMTYVHDRETYDAEARRFARESAKRKQSEDAEEEVVELVVVGRHRDHEQENDVEMLNLNVGVDVVY